MVTPERLEKGGVAIIVAAAQDEAPALYVLLHDFEKLANFMVGLLLAVTDISEREKRLGAAETTAKLGQGCIVVDGEGAGSMESPRQPLDAEDDVDEDGVDA